VQGCELGPDVTEAVWEALEGGRGVLSATGVVINVLEALPFVEDLLENETDLLRFHQYVVGDLEHAVRLGALTAAGTSRVEGVLFRMVGEWWAGNRAPLRPD